MDSKSYLKEAVKANKVVRFARRIDGECTGRGRGLILDETICIAVLLEDCGEPTRSHEGLAAGALVHYCHLPDAPSDHFQIFDKPAYIQNHNRCQRPKNWPPEDTIVEC